MCTPKLRASQSLILVLVAVAVLTSGGVSRARNLPLAPSETITLSAVQDSWIDINRPAKNFDRHLLSVSNSFGAPGEPDVTTQYVFLEFDLSGVAFEIKSATLGLATLTCNGRIPVSGVNVVVYGIGNEPANDWSETTLTWNTRPNLSAGSLLIALDAGEITHNTSRRYTWTDDGQGALSSWLETQRTANDSSATLVLAIDKSDQPGLAGVFFEDSEGSGAAYGCPDSIGSPALRLSSDATRFVFLPTILRSD